MHKGYDDDDDDNNNILCAAAVPAAAAAICCLVHRWQWRLRDKLLKLLIVCQHYT